MSNLRYFVDKRTGCVAVRDRTKTDPGYQGLHFDTEGVVKYWHGSVVKGRCPTCGHEISNGWTVSEKDINEAEEYCRDLNHPAEKEFDWFAFRKSCDLRKYDTVGSEHVCNHKEMQIPRCCFVESRCPKRK